MPKTTIRIDDLNAKVWLRRLSVTAPDAVARGINRVLLDIREVAAKDVATSLNWHAAAAKGFLANVRAFPFTKASARKLTGSVQSTELAGRIIAPQEGGYTLKPRANASVKDNLMRLHVGHPNSFAIPKENTVRPVMSARGRVPKAYTPKALLAKDTKRIKNKNMPGKGRPSKLGGFIFVNRKGTGIFSRDAGTRAVKMLYALFQKPARVKARLHFYEKAFKTAENNLAPKILKELYRDGTVKRG
jgi:hypothetical protein